VASRLVRDAEEATGADIVLLAVPDDAVARVAATVPPGPWLGMLSGATPLAALGDGPRRFVLHPAQTMERDGGAVQLDGVTAFVTGASPEALRAASDLARALDLRVAPLDESARPLPHLACVLASPSLVALEAAAVGVLARAGIDREAALAALRPLVEQSVARVFGAGSLTPTGPVARGDAGTIAGHLAALERAVPELLPLYRALGEATLPLVAPAAAARAATALGVDAPRGLRASGGDH
jgi:predicted short-subunit dehydrogenase-like oxidoreductase (DUF2520 family)